MNEKKTSKLWKMRTHLFKDVQQRLEDDVVLFPGERLLLSVGQALVDVQPVDLVVHLLDPTVDLGSVLLDRADPQLVPEQRNPLKLQNHVADLVIVKQINY